MIIINIFINNYVVINIVNYYNYINTIQHRPTLCINITFTFLSLFAWTGISNCPFPRALLSFAIVCIF